MEGVEEEGRGVVCEGHAQQREDVAVEQVEEPRAVAVQRHHLVMGRALGHRLDQHLQEMEGFSFK